MEIIQRYNQRAQKISLQLALLRQRAGVSRGALFSEGSESESPQSRHALRGTRHRVSQPRAALKSKTGFKRTAAYLARNLGTTTEILRKSVSRLEIRSFQPLGCFKQQELGKTLRKISHQDKANIKHLQHHKQCCKNLKCQLLKISFAKLICNDFFCQFPRSGQSNTIFGAMVLMANHMFVQSNWKTK